MPRKPWIGLVLLALLACYAPERDGYDVATLALPHGDAQAGREVFLELGCPSCHRVARETDFPAPVSAVAAPELAVVAAPPTVSGIATSILLPSHRMLPGVSSPDGLSPMADFTEVMTVRQLVDVVAYLKTQSGETVAQVTGRGEDVRKPPF